MWLWNKTLYYYYYYYYYYELLKLSWVKVDKLENNSLGGEHCGVPNTEIP